MMPTKSSVTRKTRSWVKAKPNIQNVQDIVYVRDTGKYAFTGGYLYQLCKQWYAQPAPGLPGLTLEIVAIPSPGKAMDFRACINVRQRKRAKSFRMKISRNMFTMLCAIHQNDSADMLDETFAELIILDGPKFFYPKQDEVTATV